MRSFNLLIAAFALLQCIRYARAALLFVLPSVRLRADADAEPDTPARLRAAAELEAIGFVPLGVLYASGPLGAWTREADTYASVAARAFADVVQERSGDAAYVEFHTPFADGAAVVTSTASRRTVVTADAQAGSMPGAPVAAVLAAHEKGVDRLARAHGAPDVGDDLSRRVEAARRWYRGEGRRDLRRSHVVGFLVVVLALALFASSAHILLRAPAPG